MNAHGGAFSYRAEFVNDAQGSAPAPRRATPRPASAGSPQIEMRPEVSNCKFPGADMP
jgi:hypothetical protein